MGPDGCAKTFRPDLGDRLADQGGSELVGGGIGVDAGVLAGEVENKLVTEAAFVEELLFAEPVFVATPLVSAEAIDGQGFAIVPEVFDDGAVRHAIENGLADFVAKDFGKAGNFSVTTRFPAETNSGMEWWSGGASR
jgi:hypothetical protein